jgi:hypothetical protein
VPGTHSIPIENFLTPSLKYLHGPELKFSGPLFYMVGALFEPAKDASADFQLEISGFTQLFTASPNVSSSLEPVCSHGIQFYDYSISLANPRISHTSPYQVVEERGTSPRDDGDEKKVEGWLALVRCFSSFILPFRLPCVVPGRGNGITVKFIEVELCSLRARRRKRILIWKLPGNGCGLLSYMFWDIDKTRTFPPCGRIAITTGETTMGCWRRSHDSPRWRGVRNCRGRDGEGSTFVYRNSGPALYASLPRFIRFAWVYQNFHGRRYYQRTKASGALSIRSRPLIHPLNGRFSSIVVQGGMKGMETERSQLCEIPWI